MNFSETERQQVAARNIKIATVQKQVRAIRRGFRRADIVRPATIGDGIWRLTPIRKKELLDSWKTKISQQKITKFVPASGAATRMFQELLACQKNHRITPSVQHFLENLERLAIFPSLLQVAGATKITELRQEKNYLEILKWLLSETGLGLAQKPKALIPFQIRNARPQTPIAQHAAEANALELPNLEVCFSVAAEHQADFEQEIAKLNFPNLKIRCTIQSPTTDAVALTASDELLVDESNQIVWRPGGHGALIHNLNEFASDYVFIKNVDNLAPSGAAQKNLLYKKYLLALLGQTQQKIFEYLQNLATKNGSELKTEIRATTDFLQKNLFRDVSAIQKWPLSAQKNFLENLLDRPLRVCGMVKNEGQPGGGPFWVRDADGQENLQIVETAELPPSCKKISKILEKASQPDRGKRLAGANRASI